MTQVKITDTTFRDGQQSLMATRLRTEDVVPMAQEMDSLGFNSIEVWGGATFDAATRFLGEDPWERLRTFKRLMPNTPLQMLLRGQALVGYRSYADDVVDAFVERAAESGIDVFRVFDALNDERNLARSASAIRRSGKHLQMTICYSVTEGGQLGGDIYNLEYYLDRARIFLDMGADSICVKDMAGLLAPLDAFELFTALRSTTELPLQLHTHYTSGMASMSSLKAIEAGLDVLDACLAPLALRTAQPAVEPLVMALKGTRHDTGLNLETLLGLGDQLEKILPRYREYMENSHSAVIDAKVLSHQIPGGMTSNLASQLREADALDRMSEVLEDIPRTRKDLGYPPLVTPISQMVGSQAVSNVLFGRYKMVSDQVKDYVRGRYGRPPALIDPDVVKIGLDGYEHGDTLATERPADLIEPELKAAADAIEEISTDIDDVLTYALYPTTGLKFLRIKHGLDPVPPEMQLPAKSDVHQLKYEDADVVRTPAPTLASAIDAKSQSIRAFNVYVGEEIFRVEVDEVSSTRAPMKRVVETGAPQRSPDQSEEVEQAQSFAVAPGEQVILAPMPGLVLRYNVEVGQRVSEGDTVVVLEAMKMENALPAPVAGDIKALPLQEGANVVKGDVLAIIGS